MVGAASRRASIADVARAAGVSSQTVSRYFTGVGYVRDSTRARIADAIRELDYRPNLAARNLRSQRSHAVGVLAMGGLNYGSAQLLAGLSDAARGRGYSLSTVHLDLDYEARDWGAEARRALEHFLAQQVDGIIVSTPVHGIEDIYPELHLKARVITISEHPHPAYASASMRSHEAALLATRHLISLGHSRIVHVAGPETRNEAFERERGYRDAMTAAGLEPWVATGARDWNAASGFDAAERLSESDFTAVFAANDEIALGFLSAMAERGRTAPDDFSIAGVDDMPSAAYFIPPLTSVRLDFRRLGTEAFDLMYRMIEGPGSLDRIVVEPELVPRASTAALEAL
jgi:DNA-binding LacI/PurR family transcriptional regulator